VARAVVEFEKQASSLGNLDTIGEITIGCALGYLDFRYANEPWRPGHPDARRNDAGRLTWFRSAAHQRPSLNMGTEREARQLPPPRRGDAALQRTCNPDPAPHRNSLTGCWSCRLQPTSPPFGSTSLHYGDSVGYLLDF
jgi:hypothetical protein